MLHERHWSVEEANSVLAFVGARLDRMRQLLAAADTEAADEAFGEIRALPGGGYPGRPLAEAAVELALGIDELELAGIVVRDLERGLIDFPALRDGEEIYLCWLRDEPEVTHWHRPEAGFAGREPL